MGFFTTTSTASNQPKVAPSKHAGISLNTQLADTEGSSFKASEAKSTGRLRSTVERRFRSMFEAHDRIRTELLASHVVHTK